MMVEDNDAKNAAQIKNKIQPNTQWEMRTWTRRAVEVVRAAQGVSVR
jgi:hypothetical protein